MKRDIKEITGQLEKGVREVYESDKYKEYLDFMSKFYNYSVNNIILIMSQNPEASLIAGYKSWQTKFKRHVKKGEKGIMILAPCPHKIVKEDENGEQKETTWTTFRPVSVFDVSQTEGEDIPTGCVDALTGNVDNYEDMIEKLIKVSPAQVTFEDITGTPNGLYNLFEKKIVIQEGMSEQQTVKTLIHEISHAILHDKDTGDEKDADTRTMEVQAESVAYTVCRMIGIDASDYSFGYVAGWGSGKEIKELTASMEVIKNTAKYIVDRLQAV